MSSTFKKLEHETSTDIFDGRELWKLPDHLLSLEMSVNGSTKPPQHDPEFVKRCFGLELCWCSIYGCMILDTLGYGHQLQ